MFINKFCRNATRVTLSSSQQRVALMGQQQKRFLNLHEYQAHQLLAKHGINTPKGKAVTTPEAAAQAMKELGLTDAFVKAQVLAGGRGRGTFKNGFQGGVHKVSSAEEAKQLAEKMLGQILVTIQSGAQGKPVNTVFVQQKVTAAHEMYFAILLDRQSGGPVLIGSSRGGMAIEDVAREDPSAITKIPIDITKGISRQDAERMARDMAFTPKAQALAADQITKLYDLFLKSDATMVEVNPMIETTDAVVLCADCKLGIDDNAEFRQKEIFSYRDLSQEDEREVQASKFDLNYVGLDGNIGCIVNGAGLAMATMDIIKFYGGEPANFLDVGGGANKQQIVEALKILNSDKQVKAILVNIFGGIMRCDLIAEGLISAIQELGSLRAPIVVRLQGTNVELAKKILAESGISLIPAEDLDDAASKAVKLIH